MPTKSVASSQERPVDADPRSHLDRLLKPSSIALVGLSDTAPLLSMVEPTFESGAEIFFVNPRRETVRGEPCYPSLTALDRPVDAVMCCVSAERSTEVVEEAAALDVGGLVLIAAGFVETSAGVELQARLKAAADRSGLAIVGPNGIGLINVRREVRLTMASPHRRRPGGVSVVSHSGAMLSGTAMAAWTYPDMGLNLLISAGNEATTDLADYVDYFADDPDTKAIGLIIEKIRRPAEFFAAVARATAAGKPLVALKLARGDRSQRMAASHTGALTGDAWVYDVALKQAGIALAYDIEELVDRLSLFDQLPPHRWSPVRSLGALTRTGGFASLCADLAEVEGVPLAPLDHYADWMAENFPGAAVPNPLDAASYGKRLEWGDVIAKYVADPDLDAILVVHPTTDEDMVDKDGVVRYPMFEEYANAAAQVKKPCVVANCSGVPGDWIADSLQGVLVRGRGLRPSLRGLATLGAFVRHCEAAPDPIPTLAPLPRPSEAPVELPEGPMLPFAATMDLLAEHGIPVAPFELVEPEHDASSPSPGFPGPYAVKLADVAHRTEHQAVRLSVDAADLAAAIRDLRTVAQTAGLSATVAVQPMHEIRGEALLGIQGESELGSLVVFGLGGIFAEALNRVGGRMAPFGPTEARALIDEFADLKVMHGFRGRPAWELDRLAEIVVAAGEFAARGRDWIASLDINPLVYGPTGFSAVDALLLLRPV